MKQQFELAGALLYELQKLVPGSTVTLRFADHCFFYRWNYKTYWAEDRIDKYNLNDGSLDEIARYIVLNWARSAGQSLEKEILKK